MTAKCTMPCGRTFLIDTADHPLLAGFNWYSYRRHKVFYVRGTEKAAGRRVRLHLHLMGGGPIDHRSGDGLDNRRSDLRPCTNHQNAQNVPVHRDAQGALQGRLQARRPLPRPNPDL